MLYQRIDKIFQQHDSNLNAAEAHGIASAMLCLDQRANLENWLDEIFADDESLSEDSRQTLAHLFAETRRLLNPTESSFEFDLLLPTDVSLAKQTLALTDWCQGFLWGMGYFRSGANWTGETQGILQDMIEITKTDLDINDDNHEDEQAFVQIHEYLRAAVLTIRDELSQPDSRLH